MTNQDVHRQLIRIANELETLHQVGEDGGINGGSVFVPHWTRLKKRILWDAMKNMMEVAEDWNNACGEYPNPSR